MSLLTPAITKCVLSAEAKALATDGPRGLNVVPVSTIKVENDQIILVDYFFGKTAENLVAHEKVALTAWSGLKGFQIKAEARYLTSGIKFDEVVAWIAQLHPERTVKGIAVLSPTQTHDISIG